jgi:heat shock protein HtpX
MEQVIPLAPIGGFGHFFESLCMKRIFLFLATNLAIMVVLGIVTSVFGLNRYVGPNGLNLGALLGYALATGFIGAFISLLISKPMAKWSTGARVIETPQNQDEAWIVDTVRKFADKAGIGMPEVAVYEGEPNAFATGAFKNSALVAVSTGLLQGMTKEEVEAVIAHEVAHIANGDMVTMALIQGVMNTFVVFLSRVIGYLVDSALRKGDDRSGPGIGFTVTTIVLDIVLGFLASMVVAWFSRKREFAADAGAATFMGQGRSMQAALARLGGLTPGELPKSVAAMGIMGGLGKLFSTHPPIEERIAALQARG